MIIRNTIGSTVIFFSSLMVLSGFLGFGGFIVSLMGLLLIGLAITGMNIPDKIKIGMSIPVGFGFIMLLIIFSQTLF